MVSIVAVIIYILIFGLILAIIGHSKGLGYLGLIVDERGKYSLSRLQALLWTFLIGAAYIGIAAETAKFIGVPDNLLALMGVSLGSAVASQAIKSNKIDQNTVAANTNDSVPAKFMDMVSEEEINYENRLSLGKFQMLIWTFVSLAIYIIILIKSRSSNLTELPDVTFTMVELMGISQATYLFHKIPN
jgi:hypothetical protein